MRRRKEGKVMNEALLVGVIKGHMCLEREQSGKGKSEGREDSDK